MRCLNRLILIRIINLTVFKSLIHPGDELNT